jgi:hypothetical protein
MTDAYTCRDQKNFFYRVFHKCDIMFDLCGQMYEIKGNKCYLCLHFVKLERIYDFY